MFFISPFVRKTMSVSFQYCAALVFNILQFQLSRPQVWLSFENAVAASKVLASKSGSQSEGWTPWGTQSHPWGIKLSRMNMIYIKCREREFNPTKIQPGPSFKLLLLSLLTTDKKP